jgi:hypothetical protein
MPPRYKLSPAFIAMLLTDKSKASPLHQPGSDKAMRPSDPLSARGTAEPDFTPLEEILGERPAAVPRPPSGTVSRPTSTMRSEPQLNLPTMDDVWRQTQAAKQPAAAYDAIGASRRPAEGGMFTPPSVRASTAIQLGKSGGRATSPHDFSSGFPNGKYDELSALGDLAPDAQSRGPAQPHVFGQGIQFAANQSEPSQSADWQKFDARKYAIDPKYPRDIPVPGSGFALEGPSLLHPPSMFPQSTRGAPDGLGEKYRALARAIGMGEGDYEAHNSGTSGNQILNGVAHGAPVGGVTGKSINGIMATYTLPVTDPNRLFAVGAYQITPDTLHEAKTKMGLTGNELMTPAMQDRIFAEFLVRRDLKAFLKDPRIGVDQAQFSAAHQWASIAVPKGYPTGKRDAKRRPIISDGTMSYYGGGNSANMNSTRELRRILESWHQPAEGSGQQRSPDIGR